MGVAGSVPWTTLTIAAVSLVAQDAGLAEAPEGMKLSRGARGDPARESINARGGSAGRTDIRRRAVVEDGRRAPPYLHAGCSFPCSCRPQVHRPWDLCETIVNI